MRVALAAGCSASTSSAPQAPCCRARPAAGALQAQRQRQPACSATAAPAAAAVAAAGRRRHVRRLLLQAHASPPAVVAAAAEAGESDVEEWVEVGKIGPPHGVRGEMKVQPLTDFPEDRLGEPGARWLQAPAPKIGRRKVPPPEEVELEWGRSMISKGNEVWLVKLEGIESPEEAAELRGHMLLIPASAREPLEDEDEFYVQDLVGLTVVLQATGEEIGHVSDVFDGTGTHDVLRIQLSPAKLEQLAAAAAAAPRSSGEEEEEEEEEEEGQAAAGGGGGGQRHVLMPFAKAMVPVVDLKGKRMEITPPAGLLELAAPSNMQRQRRENRGKRERRRTRPKGREAAEAGVAAAAGAPLHSDVE